MKDPMTKRSLRCAIYTRVSTDQGLNRTSTPKTPNGRLQKGIVTLPHEERDRMMKGTGSHAAATASRHVLIAAARSARCD